MDEVDWHKLRGKLEQEHAGLRGRLCGEVERDGPVLVALALAAAAAGRIEEAGALLRAAGSIGHVVKDSDREPLVVEAERISDHAAAVGHVERLLAACPGFSVGQQARLRLRLGRGLGGLERNAESLEVLQELCSGPLAAALGERARDARTQVASALIRFERHAEALTYLEDNSMDAREQNLIGVCCCALGRFDAALVAYRKSRKLHGGWIVPRDNAGWVHQRRGEFERAIRVHRAVIAADASYARAHYHLALALAARGELDEAATELERAVALGHDVAGIREDPYAQPLRGTATYWRVVG